MIKHFSYQNQTISCEIITKKTNRHSYLRFKNGKFLFIVGRNGRYLDVDAIITASLPKYAPKILAYQNRPEIDTKELLRRAKTDLPPLVDYHAEVMGLKPSRLSFRYNRTRWGSCSAKNAISLNSALATLPLELRVYVIIHELAHIKHKHHQAPFWQLVSQYCPHYKTHDKKLKEFSL